MVGKLYNPKRAADLTYIRVRMAFIIGLVAATVLVLYWEGEGLLDTQTGKPPDFPSLIYFAMVTITTVGYGDIIPVTTFSKMVDTFVLVPIRFIVLFTFLGTAYHLAFRRFQEEYQMKRAVNRLEDHVIICGYGATGRSVVEELLLQGTPAEQIVVLDPEDQALEPTSEMGVVAIQADATQEAVMKTVAVERAAHLIICCGRDDTSVLIALTANALNPKLNIVAACRLQENVKLLQRSGAHVIVSPATAGGTLLAAATRRSHLVETMQEVLSVGGAMRLDERPVHTTEIGKRPGELEQLAVLRLYRDGRHYDLGALPVIEEGDRIVFVASAASGVSGEG